ncbi:MAG TPA: hypothetical protein VJ695_03330 [Nitrososphaera sp.]|nr:hypothetical protein [Nitrososphaera sp.]
MSRSSVLPSPIMIDVCVWVDSFFGAPWSDTQVVNESPYDMFAGSGYDNLDAIGGDDNVELNADNDTILDRFGTESMLAGGGDDRKGSAGISEQSGVDEGVDKAYCGRGKAKFHNSAEYSFKLIFGGHDD